jgi:hypothetical protein
VRLFDEEGYGAAKKAQRNNEDLSKVKELTTFFFTHKVNKSLLTSKLNIKYLIF